MRLLNVSLDAFSSEADNKTAGPVQLLKERFVKAKG